MSTKVMKKHYILYSLVATAAMMLCILFSHLNAYAAEGFNLYTETPGINLTAGDSASFSLYITGTDAEGTDVDLSVESIPDGFTGYFKSGSYEVNRVHATGSSDTAVATFEVTVPTEASNGSNKIVIKAVNDAGMEDELTIDINVSELESGESNFNVEYPDQEGATGTTFSYSTTIANNTLTDQNYNFSSNAPEGWTVSFTSDSTQVSSLDVASGSSAGVTITLTPPNNVEAGDYTISCSAASAKENLSTDLNVKILGTYSIGLTTSDGVLSLDAYANKTSDVDMVVTNNGNIELDNITLTSQANDNWDVSFDESTIESLAPGASETVTAHIKPSNDSITGDYITNIVASCDNQSTTTQLRVTVKTQTGWGIFAVIIIIAVCGGLYYVIKKYGRR